MTPHATDHATVLEAKETALTLQYLQEWVKEQFNLEKAVR